VRFWDTSALVPLVVNEPATMTVASLLADDPDIVVWALTPVEITSALSRRASGHADAHRDAQALLHAVESTWTVVNHLESVAARARHLLTVHALRAADALQLAAALTFCEDQPVNLPFLTLDRRLAIAARAEGFTVLP
jgi:predicted nucleic acid-binding protein